MRSIRRRLTRDLVAATGVLLGGGLVAVYLAAREALLDQFDDALRAKALAISTVTTATDTAIRVAFSDRFLRGFDDDKERDFFQLWGADGETIARSESLGRRRELPWRRGRPDKPARWDFTLPGGEPGRGLSFAFTPRREGGGSRDGPEVRLVVASEREELDETLWHLLGLSAGCGVILLGATVVLIPIVLRRGLRPLAGLGEQAQRIHAGSLSMRFDAATFPSELQPIAARLNELLTRLDRSFERERRFSTDLAHELRTPLAELRSMAECALKWPEARGPTDRETLAVVQHMETLVTQMLALARGEQGGLTAKSESVSVDELVAEVWRGFAGQAVQRGLATDLAIEPVRAPADRALLRSILVNLCANAVDYTPDGGRIRLATRMAEGRPAVEIANTTAGLEPGDVDRLFDRFWRKEAARGGTHFGLGLSLAQSFATAMKWSLAARLEPDGWLVFTLRSA